jgi:hypothetical protein
VCDAGVQAVRAHVLAALESARASIAERWTPVVDRLLRDRDGGVRAAAVHAVAAFRKEDASTLMRRYLSDPEPRVAVAAAVVLADSGVDSDADAAKKAQGPRRGQMGAPPYPGNAGLHPDAAVDEYPRRRVVRSGFLRYKVLAAIERLRREHPNLVFDREPMEALLLKEASRYYNYLTLRFNVVRHDADASGSLLPPHGASVRRGDPRASGARARRQARRCP